MQAIQYQTINYNQILLYFFLKKWKDFKQAGYEVKWIS